MSDDCIGFCDCNQTSTLSTEVMGGQGRGKPSNNLILRPERLTGNSGDERRLVLPLTSDLEFYRHGTRLELPTVNDHHIVRATPAAQVDHERIRFR